LQVLSIVYVAAVKILCDFWSLVHFFVFFWLFLQVFLIGELAAACVFFLPCYTGCVMRFFCLAVLVVLQVYL